jgi:WD40 repeat protein
LADEPDEWPTQLVARLQRDKTPGIQRILEGVSNGRTGCWLKPIRAPLIAPGGPIIGNFDVGIPYENSGALIWSKDRSIVTSFFHTFFWAWDLRTQREVWRLDIPVEWGMAAISNPPRRAVVMAEQRRLLVVDLKTAKYEVIFDEPTLERVAISANGAWAVASAVPPDWDYIEHNWDGPRTLRLFDLRRRRSVRTWQAHRGLIIDLAMNEIGTFLATASYDGTASLFDLRSEKEVGSWRSTRRLDAVAITWNAQRIAYMSQGGVLMVRRPNGKVLSRFSGYGAQPGCLAFSRDGRKLVMASGGGVSVIDLGKSKRSGPFSGPQTDLISLAISDTGRGAISGERGRRLVLWDLATPGKRTRQAASWISGIWASEDQAVVHGDGLSLWDLSTGKRRGFLPFGNYLVTCAPSAGLWAVARWTESHGGRIRIGKWGQKGTCPLFHSNDLATSIQISLNGLRLAATIHARSCWVMNLADRKMVWRGEREGIVKPYLSPSGRYLVLCSFLGSLEVIDLDANEVIRGGVPKPVILPVLFAPGDESVLLEQGDDTALLNWRTGSLRTLFPGKPSSISEDGRWVATESKGRKLSLWLVPDERRMATFTLDTPILRTALSPDGRYIIVGDDAGGVHILQRQN